MNHKWKLLISKVGISRFMEMLFKPFRHALGPQLTVFWPKNNKKGRNGENSCLFAPFGEAGHGKSCRSKCLAGLSEPLNRPRILNETQENHGLQDIKPPQGEKISVSSGKLTVPNNPVLPLSEVTAQGLTSGR